MGKNGRDFSKAGGEAPRGRSAGYRLLSRPKCRTTNSGENSHWWIIREAETEFHRWEENPARNRTSDRYNWVRFVLHRLAVPCEKSEDLKRNNVTFITFNYDTSLEDRIERGLRQISLFDQKDIAEFISPDRFLHVYGTIRNDTYPTYTPLMPLHQPGGKIDPQHAAQFFEQMYCISKGIRTIDPHDKVDDVILTRARNAIKSATCFYVLGFGFDRNNCRRIGLEHGVFNAGTPAPYKNVVFTNLADSNRINKDASRAFCGTPDNFFNTFRAHGNLVAYEKSILNCYEALARDFDEMEAG